MFSGISLRNGNSSELAIIFIKLYMNGPKYLYTSLPKYFVLPSILCTPKFAPLDLWKFTIGMFLLTNSMLSEECMSSPMFKFNPYSLLYTSR